ncbi:hypothetical protein IFM61606_10197 [Aspergillus udagawae]|nr:hypothetical protein IFM61606_10197 [Aspergillus udagawae]
MHVFVLVALFLSAPPVTKTYASHKANLFAREVSPDGSCGGTTGYICPDTEPCCSKHGYCGNTNEYCGIDCQPAFGTCPATSTGTVNIPRLHIGQVPYGEVIDSCAHPGDIALTFDDGPYLYTSDLLDLLARYGVKATFFVVGNNGNGVIDEFAAWKSAIQRMDSEGHQVGSHTWNHPDLTTLSSAQSRDQMYQTEQAFANILGKVPTYMRPPYLSFDTACAVDMFDLGYHAISTNLDTKDFANDDPALIQNSKDIFNNYVTQNSPSSTSFVVLNHDIHYQTVYTLAEYEIQRLQTAGYRPVTVGECLGDPEGNWYRSASGVTTAVLTEPFASLPVSPPTNVCTYVRNLRHLRW